MAVNDISPAARGQRPKVAAVEMALSCARHACPVAACEMSYKKKKMYRLFRKKKKRERTFKELSPRLKKKGGLKMSTFNGDLHEEVESVHE